MEKKMETTIMGIGSLEGMEKKMKTTRMRYIGPTIAKPYNGSYNYIRTTIRIHSFITTRSMHKIDSGRTALPRNFKIWIDA